MAEIKKIHLLGKTTIVLDEQANIGDTINIDLLNEIKIDDSAIQLYLSNVQDRAFDKKVQEKLENEKRVILLNTKAELEAKKREIVDQKNNEIAELNAKFQLKDSEIATLNQCIKFIEEQKMKDVQIAINDKENEIKKKYELQEQSKEEKIQELENQKTKITAEKDIEITKFNTKFQLKDSEIAALKQRIQAIEEQKTKDIIIAVNKKENEYTAQINSYETKIELKEKEIELLKKKSKLSFQDWNMYPDGGLEKYCENLYETKISQYYPDAFFKKDTTTIQGTKGDFIFKEKNAEGFEFSISFEMKNEKENNIKGLRIENHYKQANDNRIKKGCKYSVIVTTLEPDADFWMKKVSETKYPNMWVVRPEFFEQVIAQLRDKEYSLFKSNKILNGELTLLKEENRENLSFEKELNSSKEEMFKSYKNFISNFDDDSKDLADIVLIVMKLWKRRHTEKSQLNSVMQKTFDLSSKEKETIELKDFKRQFNELKKKRLEFNSKEEKQKEIALLLDKTIDS